MAAEPNYDTTALTPYQAPISPLVRPLVAASDMLAAIREYEALKAAIIQKSDIQMISGRQHIKKSGWLRIARAFNLTVEPVSEQYVAAEDGTWGYAIVVRAVAPNGASMQGDGLCWSTEKKQESQRTRHNVRAHAYTRASNRAISNLVGGGEVSAEEMADYDDARTVESGNGNGRNSNGTQAVEKPTQKQWGGLQARAVGAGKVKNLAEFESVVKRITGKAMRDCSMADYNGVIASLANQPEPAPDAEVSYTEEDADGHDLAALGTGNGVRP